MSTQTISQPSPLYNTCFSIVTQHLKQYTHIGCADELTMPSMIKNSIIDYVVKVQGGFDDDGQQLAVLLNPTLIQLNLTGSTITDRVLLAIVEKCPNLKRLTLTKGNYLFTRKGLKVLFGRLHDLEEISVKNCALVDDSLVAKLALNCPNLNLLDLEACANVSNCSAEFLKHRRITQLNLSHTGISDKFFEVLADSPCGTALIDLNVSYCNVTSTGLENMNWNSLKYLGIEGCDLDDFDCIDVAKNLSFIHWTT
uniref:Putative scf ubiquitin ligase skp2 component n=1 Tax=Culex tarsalis TaxID=7177 RepID=A0A1Q3EVI3_CULTA